MSGICSCCKQELVLWPKIIKDGCKIRVSFPADRPYTPEIIEYMESKEYVLCGAVNGLTTDELIFRPKNVWTF